VALEAAGSEVNRLRRHRTEDRQVPARISRQAQFIAVMCIYTTVLNIIERPEGNRIASVFYRGIIVISLLARVRRSFELHATCVHLDRQALEFMSSNLAGPIALIAHERPKLGVSRNSLAF
jgi:hypothetical protein